MATNYQQEDTASACGTVAGCSGKTVADTPIGRLCVEGGTAGTGTPQVKSTAGELDRAAVMFEMQPANGGTWGAGNYVVRLNITTANSAATWIATYVCRFNSGCTNQETIGSLTGQSTGLGSTGVKTHTVSGSSVTPADNDKVYVILVVDFAADHGNVAFNFTPDQLIDTPIVAGAADDEIAAMSHQFAAVSNIRAGSVNR